MCYITARTKEGEQKGSLKEGFTSKVQITEKQITACRQQAMILQSQP